MNKEIKERQRTLDNYTLTTKLTFSDGSIKYIVIVPDIIFVSDIPTAEMYRQKAINDDIYESLEVYDTTDGRSYYLDSEFAEAISDELLYLATCYLNLDICK